MAKPKKEQWEQDFENIVVQHYDEQIKVNRLNNQLHRLMVKHTNIKFDIAQGGDKFAVKIEMMENMRHQLSKLLNSKTVKLSQKKTERLRKIQARLPSDSLGDRVWLMELVGQLPRYETTIDPQGNWMRFWNSKDIHRQARHKRGLKRLNAKILSVISDIHDLQSIIKYVKNTRASKFQITPFVERYNWLEIPAHNPEVKATIALTTRKHILKHIPKVMPDMFNYLDVD